MHGLRRAVFLDRDGVINHNIWNQHTGEFEAPLRASQFVLVPGVTRSLRRLMRAGYLLFLVSNQPNYAKGKAGLDEPAAIHRLMLQKMKRAGVSFAGCFYCFHHPEGSAGYGGVCLCRKPSPYFLLLASRRFDVHLAESWMVGDRPTDIACGHAAGTRTIFIGEGCPGPPHPDAEARNLQEAAEVILRGDGAPVYRGSVSTTAQASAGEHAERG